jgi:CheY-like chemotaxis protein
MDVQMPVMNGLETTRRIRDPESNVLNHKIPIVAMTAHAMAGDREKCLSAGMIDYVTKPIMPQALKLVLERWLVASGSRAAKIPEASTLFEQATPQKEPPVFNRTRLLVRLMDDPGLARDVAHSFIKETPQFLDALQDSLERGDVLAATDHAHGIKGSAANINGEAMSQLAYEMQKLGKVGALGSMAARMPELRRQFDLLTAALLAELK